MYGAIQSLTLNIKCIFNEAPHHVYCTQIIMFIRKSDSFFTLIGKAESKRCIFHFHDIDEESSDMKSHSRVVTLRFT